jgi:hypothetical protein
VFGWSTRSATAAMCDAWGLRANRLVTCIQGVCWTVESFSALERELNQVKFVLIGRVQLPTEKWTSSLRNRPTQPMVRRLRSSQTTADG